MASKYIPQGSHIVATRAGSIDPQRDHSPHQGVVQALGPGVLGLGGLFEGDTVVFDNYRRLEGSDTEETLLIKAADVLAVVRAGEHASGLWWISWSQDAAQPGPTCWPPPDEVLAFWESGETPYSRGHATIDALVRSSTSKE